MDSPPVPKPRTLLQNDHAKKPVPLPRTRIQPTESNEKVKTSDIIRSIGTASKQLTGEVAEKVQKSAKSANEKIEKSIVEGTRLAKDGFERTLSGSRFVRDTLTRSVVEGTKNASMKLRSGTKKLWDTDSNKKNEEIARSTSMPTVDVSLFDNLQFHSPLLELKKYSENETGEQRRETLSNSILHDDRSLLSSHSDNCTDTTSDLSLDREQDGNSVCNESESSSLTYDTPKAAKLSLRKAPTLPNPPERASKGERLSFLRQNSIYENWDLPEPSSSRSGPQQERPSKSTIYEFDPLKLTDFKFDGKSNELLLLECFLIGDTYGTLGRNIACSNESLNETSLLDPPTPPERFDSLPASDLPEESANKESNANWFTQSEPGPSLPNKPTSPGTSSVMKRFSNILKFDTIGKGSKEKVEKPEQVERPPITDMPASFHSGTLTRIMGGAMDELFKNSVSRYCVLGDKKLLCYTDPTSSILKESFTLCNIYSIQIVLPLSSSSTDNYYCFEVNLNGGGSKATSRKLLFSCTSAPERRTWAKAFVEHLSDGFPVKYSSELTRFGWCYIRDGVGAQWCGAWIMLIRRILAYYTSKDKTIRTIDLRKTICIVTQEPDEATKQTCPTDGSSSLLLDNPGLTLYLRFSHERELKSWKQMVKLAAHNNGMYIHHQQLTKEDVPAIVDKCINFVYVYGSMSEGIYRRAGSSVAISDLLTQFRKDAFSVRLSKETHSEHDISTVLKRFFRNLSEPLIPQELHNRLVEASQLKDQSHRCVQYSVLLQDMPTVSRQSARKLFAHLHFVQNLSSVNKMTAENLAAVWAPTVMPAAVINSTMNMVWSAREVNVVRDLISFYPAIFKPSNVELERERTMLAVLNRAANSSVCAPQTQRCAGDLRIWVYLNEYGEGKCESISLTPTKTCEDICVELCSKMSKESHSVMIEEVVCGGALKRVVLYHELVLDVVLQWGYWDDEDRKDNYLILKDNKPLQEMEALRGKLSLVCGELKFANEKSKSFKQHMFELQCSKLTYFKDKQGSSVAGEYEVGEYLWYVGFETKRNPHTRWAITFVPKNKKPKRCKERPWFGCTIAGSVTEDQLRWLSAIASSDNSASLLPTPRLIMT